MKKINIFLVILELVLLEKAYCLPLPFNEYSFVLARNYVKMFDSNGPIESNDKEKVVKIYFEKLKADEFLRTGLSGFYPLQPIETVLDSIINSDIYAQLKLLPKGGNLHMHEDQMANRKDLLEIIKANEEYDYLYICDKTKEYCLTNVCNCTDYFLTYIKNPIFAENDGWVKVKDSNWTTERILNKTTLTGILNNLEVKVSPTDSSARWKTANSRGFFGFYADLIVYNKTRFDYLKSCLDNSLNENVQLIEFRRSNFDGLYYFDENGNRVYLPLTDEIDRLLQFKKDYITQNPSFIDFNYIIFGRRARPKEEIRNDLELAINTQKMYPNFIKGYDLVAEEDQGHSLLFHADTLISGFNYSYTSINSSFNYYFHNAETNWPTDMMPPQFGDDTSTSNNVYDAIVFNTHRIGHGLAYIKHPNLYSYLRDRKIAIEICPASNQILGYVADVRNHPAVNYYKSGVPIVIAGDDPGSFGYNDLTVDYYLAFMSWGLNLYDFREIANNSIRYSSLNYAEKLNGYNKFNSLWFQFVNTTYDRICLNSTLFQSKINVTNVYPHYGPYDKSIEILIYGYGFEITLCEKIICYFDNIQTSGYLDSLNELICPTPLGFNDSQACNISIGFGEKLVETNLRYTFVSSNSIVIVNDTSTNIISAAQSNKFFKYFNSLCLIILSYIFSKLAL